MARLPRLALYAGLLSLAACADPEMEKRVSDLETQVKDLQTQVDTLKKSGGAGAAAAAGPTASPADEQAASELFRQANEAAEANNYDDAKAKLADLQSKYGSTRAAKRAERLGDELAVVGMDAGQLEVEKWYQGNSDFSKGKATVVVFWEAWCPHCQEEMPKLQDTYAKYQGKGLNVIALTKVTRSSSDEKVNDFIKQHSLAFPVAKETGTMSQKFAVSGIPAAAVIKDGKVVWRGHPARITDDMLNKWLS